MLLMWVGVIAFFFGIFGAPRVLAFVGLGLMVLSLVAFTVEEYSVRRSEMSGP